jgi:hypothetical protein
MSICHDAYVFDPARFATAMSPYTKLLDLGIEGYRELRLASLGAYLNNVQVQTLAKTYGGWDEVSILRQLPPESPEGPDDVAFWYVLLLFEELSRSEIPRDLGLGIQWSVIDSILERHSWTAGERELLIRGKGFRQLAERFFVYGTVAARDKEAVLAIWSQIHPFSTGGSAGWLDVTDVKRLLKELNLVRPNLLGEIGESMYQKAVKMLGAASDKGSGLCMILSG